MDFYRMTFKAINYEVAINRNSIRAVLPAAGAQHSYVVWLDRPLHVSKDIAKRIAKLDGTVPMDKDVWEVSSEDLARLFRHDEAAMMSAVPG